MSGLEIVARSDCGVASCLVEIRRARVPTAAEVSRPCGSVITLAHDGMHTPVRHASGSAVCETQQDRQGETRLHSMVGHMGFASRTDSPPPRG